MPCESYQPDLSPSLTCVISFVRERAVARKDVIAYKLACEAYSVALRNRNSGSPALKRIMRDVHETQKVAQNAKRRLLAADEKIISISAKIDQGRYRPLSALVMQVLPPELREIVYGYLCDTSKVTASDLLRKVAGIRVIDMPMVQAYEDHTRATVTIPHTTPLDVLSLWLGTKFAEQLIDWCIEQSSFTSTFQGLTIHSLMSYIAIPGARC